MVYGFVQCAGHFVDVAVVSVARNPLQTFGGAEQENLIGFVYVFLHYKRFIVNMISRKFGGVGKHVAHHVKAGANFKRRCQYFPVLHDGYRSIGGANNETHIG